jgi:SAM-dependent methyltransferase
MNANTMKLMKSYIDEHFKPGMVVLDVGSRDVNGCHRDLFPKGTVYHGLDIMPGKNVFIVAPKPYEWPIKDASYDMIISGQTFEHIEYPWETIKEIARVAKPGAFINITAPSAGEIHCFPVDTFRYHPDGMRALGKWAGLIVEDTYLDDGDRWRHCIGKFRKA